jgi:hypothetical protein
MSFLPVGNLAIGEESAMNLNGQVALVSGSSQGNRKEDRGGAGARGRGYSSNQKYLKFSEEDVLSAPKILKRQ